MRAVKSKDTTPERMVRKALRAIGVGYRLHASDLPGRPDIIFRGRKKAIFVHGCYWHGHSCKRGARLPKSNTAYWTAKIGRNKERDQQAQSDLQKMGWSVLMLWECEIKDASALETALKRFLLAD